MEIALIIGGIILIVLFIIFVLPVLLKIISVILIVVFWILVTVGGIYLIYRIARYFMKRSAEKKEIETGAQEKVNSWLNGKINSDDDD